jgi:hypothetical protein
MKTSPPRRRLSPKRQPASASVAEIEKDTPVSEILEELTSTQEASGIEVELTQDVIETMNDPFDPEKIDVKTKPMVVDLIMARVRGGEKEIDLLPDFQRRAGIWDQKRKSRLIESLLLRIPLPVFYMAADEDERWAVVDGLQRIQTLKEFIHDKTLVLSGMEFLTRLNGQKYDDLARPMQRRINETELTVHIIQPGTPQDVMFNIFKRINTGGLPLSGQEIRHAIKQGHSTKLLKELSESSAFKIATGDSIKDERMADRECILRFCAFKIHSPANYFVGDLDKLLINTMTLINLWTPKELLKIRGSFRKSMVAAEKIFGKLAFRKYAKGTDRLSPINKALFEVWAVNLAELTPSQIKILIQNKAILMVKFEKLMKRPSFVDSISMGTGSVAKVQERFKSIKKLIGEVLDV